MEFINKIKYQTMKLSSDAYIRHVLATLRKEEIPEISPDEKQWFESSLPLELGRFLFECNTILNDCQEAEFDFREINAEYVIAIIYSALTREDTPVEEESIPMQGLIMYLMLNSGIYVDALELDEIMFETMFEKVIELYMHRVQTVQIISTNFMLAWNKFLVTNKKSIDLEQVVDLFLLTLTNNPISIIDSLNIDHQISLSKLVFVCLATIIDTHQSGEQKEIVTLITVKLMITCNHNGGHDTLVQNVLFFFKHVVQNFFDERWYFPLLIIILKQVKNKEIFIRIINQLPIDKHESITNIMISNYIEATEPKHIELYLVAINLVIKYPYQDVPDDRRQKLVKRILTETYLRGSHKNYLVREHVMDLFICWSQMKDINVRHTLQLMFHHGNKMHMAQLFEVLQQYVDLAWKVPSYNITFIVFTCRMFILNRNFISQNRMRILEILCYKSTAHCLKPCVPVLMELIKHFALAPHPILKPMLTLVLNNALSATNASNYYLKELFNLLSNCMVATNDSELEFSLCNTILSDDFNCMELFKMIRIHHFVRTEHIEVLLQEKVLKNTCSWKLLTILLENIDYTTFPPYMEHYFTKMKLASFFICPESIYILQVLTKIFMAKIKTNAVVEHDSKLAIMIDTSISNHIRDMTVPPKQIGDAIILLITLNKITHFSVNWFNNLFADILTIVLDKLDQSQEELARFPLARHIIYLEQMLLLLDMNIEESSIRKLVYAMRIERQIFITHEHLYAGIVSFLGKICLKYNNWVNEAVPLLQFAMVHGPPAVQIMAMSTLYDLSNLRLHYYEPLYAGLLTLIRSERIEIRNMAVKMVIKLVNDSHIRLTCNDFITLMLILLDRNYKLCLYFIDLLENDFIHRNEHTVSKYFIHLLFYLNKYKHERYPVTLDDAIGNQDFTYERRIIIYKFLFCNLERQSQLQILDILNTDFLALFYNERLNVAPNTLNVLRDILTLVYFYASQYMDKMDLTDIDAFYKSLFEDMQRDFFTRKHFAESSNMDLDKILEKLFVSLLKLLYKIEKSNINMLPQFLSTVGVATRAFYNKVVHMVHDNTNLKNLYYELENCYKKYKEMVITEPLDVLSYCDKQEWRLYLG